MEIATAAVVFDPHAYCVGWNRCPAESCWHWLARARARNTSMISPASWSKSQHIPARVVVQSGNEALPKIFQSRVPCSGVTVTEMPAPPAPRTVRQHKAGRVLREKAGDVLQWRHFKVAAIQLCPFSETLFLVPRQRHMVAKRESAARVV